MAEAGFFMPSEKPSLDIFDARFVVHGRVQVRGGEERLTARRNCGIGSISHGEVPFAVVRAALVVQTPLRPVFYARKKWSCQIMRV